MNEIESEVEGRIVEILVENEEPVESGRPLFSSNRCDLLAAFSHELGGFGVLESAGCQQRRNRAPGDPRLARARDQVGRHYSEADRDALHMWAADEAYCVGPGPSSRSYLHIPNDYRASAVLAGVDAIHPGYGYLAERANSRRSARHTASSSSVRRRRHRKDGGQGAGPKRAMADAGVPVIPGSLDPVEDATRRWPWPRDRLSRHDQGGRRRGRQRDAGGARPGGPLRCWSLRERGAGGLRQRCALHRKLD